jgi:DNA-binding CsgD family transcriptional regulator/tetratricopeptide (TPR) repeat protein
MRRLALGGCAVQDRSVLTPSRSDAALLERAEALAKLEAALEDDGGRLVFVSGEAGVGKTTLVRRFCELRGDDARLLWGACDGLRTPRPLGPFLDIGAAVGGRLAAAIEAASKPHLMLDALLEELGAGDGTVIVLEDLHWADKATLDLLAMLGRRLDRVGALVVATHRSDELSREHPLRVLVGELSTTTRVQRLPIEPLSPAGVAQLAEPYGVDAAELYAKTGGNPFFVTEALTAGGARVPPTVRDAVLARVARLSAPGRELLDAAAVIPQRVELWLLEELAEGQLAALDECLASGILRAHANAVAFRHELARVVVEESLNPHRRLQLHRRALAALRSPPVGRADLARIAEHAEAAEDRAAVLEFAPAAGERAAALGAHREAAAQFERALRFADELPLVERAVLLERRSYECYLTDQHQGAVPALEEAMECYRAIGDPLGEGVCLSAKAARSWCTSEVAGAEQTAAAAIALLERLPPGPELARAYGAAAAVAMNLEKEAETQRYGEVAIRLSEQFGETRTLIRQLNHAATMALLHERVQEGLELFERSIALAVEAGFDEEVGRGYIHMAWAGSRTRTWHAVERASEGLTYCAERGLDLWWLYVVVYRGRAALDQGRWDDAADAAATILRQPEGAPLLHILGLTLRAVVRARRGDPDPWSPLEEARALAADKGDLQHLAPASLAHAETACLTNRAGEVRAATDEALAIARERRAGWIVGELAFWRRRAGIDEPCPPEAAAPFALHLTGDPRAAAECWLRRGCPYEAAIALADSPDDDDQRRALEELQRLGAMPVAQAVAHGLRERGAAGIPRGPRAATRSNPAGLTTRELDVLVLVCDGLRNADIADQLVLSPRTVDHHVSAILRKLEARNRGEAIAAAHRLELLAR